MLINPDTLFDPIEPPPGPETVLPSTHQELIYTLNVVSNLFNGMAHMVDAAPWADGALDNLDQAAFQALEHARQALVRFRATRECGGEA